MIEKPDKSSRVIPNLYLGDALEFYDRWPSPTTIVSDGPYGVSGYPGDPASPAFLPAIYRHHVEKWSQAATAQTTLWFWNTEVGWATIHPILIEFGWIYRNLNIWDKGIGHVAGNCNGNTLARFPTVTEVCAHYVRRPVFKSQFTQVQTVQEWLRSEWKRTRLPFYRANEAAGVKNAATRKYLTSDHMFYMPPEDVFAKIAVYANEHGDPAGAPYFVLPESEASEVSFSSAWAKYKAKFNFEYGVSNVWTEPAVRGAERLKSSARAVHSNQKPMRLMTRIINASTDPGDVLWEPFGGTCTASLVAANSGRVAYAAELDPEVHAVASRRLFFSLEMCET